MHGFKTVHYGGILIEAERMAHPGRWCLSPASLQGLEEALADTRGDRSAAARVVRVAVRPGDIKTAREKVGLSREIFARTFGLSPATLRKWENGEREPTGAARVLLTIISRETEAALRAIR